MSFTKKQLQALSKLFMNVGQALIVAGFSLSRLDHGIDSLFFFKTSTSSLLSIYLSLKLIEIAERKKCHT